MSNTLEYHREIANKQQKKTGMAAIKGLLPDMPSTLSLSLSLSLFIFSAYNCFVASSDVKSILCHLSEHVSCPHDHPFMTLMGVVRRVIQNARGGATASLHFFAESPSIESSAAKDQVVVKLTPEIAGAMAKLDRCEFNA